MFDNGFEFDSMIAMRAGVYVKTAAGKGRDFGGNEMGWRRTRAKNSPNVVAAETFAPPPLLIISYYRNVDIWALDFSSSILSWRRYTHELPYSAYPNECVVPHTHSPEHREPQLW